MKSITKIALSHGHSDHYEAMTDLLVAMSLSPGCKEWDEPVNAEAVEVWNEASRIPLVVHPAAFRERWGLKEDGVRVGPFTPLPAQAWQAAGAKIIHSEEPYPLAQGCWTTGYIPRRSFEKPGRPARLLYRQGSQFSVDDVVIKSAKNLVRTSSFRYKQVLPG